MSEQSNSAARRVAKLMLDPRGVIDRRTLWKGIGIWWLVTIIVFAAGLGTLYLPFSSITGWSFTPLYVVLAWAALMLPVKRLRDAGISLWWLLVFPAFIPIRILLFGVLTDVVLLLLLLVFSFICIFSDSKAKYAGVERVGEP